MYVTVTLLPSHPGETGLNLRVGVYPSASSSAAAHAAHAAQHGVAPHLVLPWGTPAAPAAEPPAAASSPPVSPIAETPPLSLDGRLLAAVTRALAEAAGPRWVNAEAPTAADLLFLERMQALAVAWEGLPPSGAAASFASG